MKKTQILSLGLFTILLVLTSFKDNSATRYGGSGSAQISIYNRVYSFAAAGYVRGDKVSSSTINVTVSCTNYDKAAAMNEIEKDIKYQAGLKLKNSSQEWDYDSSIDYRITSCD